MTTAPLPILVVHLEGIGDQVLALPFLVRLPQVFPERTIFLVTGAGRRALLLGLPSYYQIIETCEPDAFSQVFSHRFDVVFDLGTGYGHIADLFSGQKLQYETYVGFAKPRTLFREKVVHRSGTIPMWRQFVSLLGFFGPTSGDMPVLPFVVAPTDRRFAELLIDFKADFSLICIAPGALSNPAKKWAPGHFAACMNLLNAGGTRRFALVGSQADASIVREIQDQLNFPAENLAGLTPLGSLAHILKRSCLLVSNDNGVMHLGGLLGTPTLGLFGPTSPEKFAPFGYRSQTLKSASGDINDLDPLAVAGVCEQMLGRFSEPF
ncbi:hypothetical protein LJC71_09660 [Desulfosarcina sp. OttesenSCG-928-A07]|nr:hypothetical protein [Desulfosarcina sp. OttesenSCG-928-A07]